MPKLEKKAKKGAPSWMVSFADLQQLLLVFFILLFSTSTTDSSKLKEALSSFTGSKSLIEGFIGDKVVEFDKKEKGKDDIEVGKEEVTSKSKSEKKLELLQKELDRQQLSQNIKNAQILEQDLKNKLGLNGAEDSKKFDKKVEITATSEGVVMRFKDGVIFEPGKVTVKKEAKELLNTLGSSLEKNQSIRIEGHTDDIPTNPNSKFTSNWELSTARAISVLNHLTSEKFITPNQCSVEGFAEFKPLVKNDSDENRAKNRRVDIILLNK